MHSFRTRSSLSTSVKRPLVFSVGVSLKCLLPCFVLAFAIVPGCNNQPSTCLVTGTVHWEGKPVYPGSFILKGESGEPYVGDLTPEGKFFVQVGPPGRYHVAVQVHELSGLSKIPTKADRSSSTNAETTEPLRREDTVPAQFRSANVDIPTKYRSADSSNLSFEVLEAETDLGLINLEK